MLKLNFYKPRYIFCSLATFFWILNTAPPNAYSNADAHKYNIIIICLDTLRADHLGCYGYSRNTAPNIDQLAREGILFEWAIAQSNFTLPSHASLFTSKYVHNHKADVDIDIISNRLADKEITLAEVLRGCGYKTAAFIYNAPHLNPILGLNQGFDNYFFGEENDRRPSFEKTLPAALKWIGRHKDSKFFVFLHSNDIHEPYHSIYENFFDQSYKGRLDNEYFASGSGASFMENNLRRTPREIKHIIAHYDGGIKYADSFITELMKKLEDWALLNKTIIILLSDHGEILADRGMKFCHGFSLYDEEVHVPLIIMHPQMKKGLRINKQVQLIDIMPTVLDFLNISRNNLKLEGKSLLNLIEGKEESNDFNKYVYAECISGESTKEVINHRTMVRTTSWKFICSVWEDKKDRQKILPKTIKLHNNATISLPETDSFELYNLKKDPREKNNSINQEYKKIEEELLNKLLIFTMF